MTDRSRRDRRRRAFENISACGIAADGHAAADGDGHTVYAGVGFLFVADIGGGNQMEARQRFGGRSSGGWFLD